MVGGTGMSTPTFSCPGCGSSLMLASIEPQNDGRVMASWTCSCRQYAPADEESTWDDWTRSGRGVMGTFLLMLGFAADAFRGLVDEAEDKWGWG